MLNTANIFVDIQAHIESGRFIRDNSENRRDIRDFTFSDVDLSNCKDVLDLGCAYGFFTRGLAGRLHPEAVINGVDLWQGCEEYFVNACRESGFEGRFCLSDQVFCKRYADDSFDLVLCSYTLYFFPEAIAEIARILRPDGYFITVTHAVPHMAELVDIIKMLIKKQLGLSMQSLPLEKLCRNFSNHNAFQLLSPLFGDVREKKYTNKLRINDAALSGLINYVCFKRPLFLPKDCDVDKEFIQTVVADHFHDLLSRQEYLTISKNDAVYICRQPLDRVSQQYQVKNG